MSLRLKEDIQQAASIVHRSSRTIRRWIAQGIDIRDTTSLQKFANQASDHAFGRQGNGARLMGRKGGSRTSDAKRRSSQANGKRGGRPKDGMLLLRKAISYEKRLDLRNTPDNDLKAIWSTLVDLEDNYLFWVGDILNEIAKRHGDASAKWAIKHSPNPEKFQEAKMISQRFSPTIGQRRFNLDWRYYREVVAECGRGNTEMALKWLQAADYNKWTVVQMRAAIRQSMGVDKAPRDTVPSPKQISLTSVIKRATQSVKEVLKDNPVDQWDLDGTYAFVDDIEPLLDIIRQVQKRYDSLEESHAVR
jgi:hypothetical protein